MDSFMTLPADDQGLAMAGGHPLDPLWLHRSSRALDVGQASNVVNLDFILGAAELAGIGQEPFEQF